MRLSYRASERLELALRLQYESFEAEDWAIEGVGPATIPVILSLGEDPYDYEVWLASIGFRYLIGNSTK